jgi:DNA helicase-2/ATP-dependent DNA helicase PcrA
MMTFDELNDKQRDAVEHGEGPLLIVAGAGSGKTKTLTSRLAMLLQKGIKPENIVAITFTNKAAGEMRERTEKLLGAQKEANKEMFLGTFHSFGARILKREARIFGRTANYTIFDADDSKALIKKVAAGAELSERDTKRLTPLVLRKEFSKIKDEMIDPEDAEDETVYKLFKLYEQALQTNNAFDFDDLIQKPVMLFLGNPEILDAYQERFKYILVDEYQDTNTAQYTFIKLLAKKYRNLSVVGDDQQSIFKFRGSDFRNFLNFEKDWPDAKVVLLEENYRSTQNIIKAASAVIAKNSLQKSKTLWTNNPEGARVKVVEQYSADGEAEWIAGHIGMVKTFSDYSSLAILYRTNAQSRAIEQALIERGISYRIFGGLKFYERKEIKDLVAALRYGSNPQDSISLERLKKSFLKKPYEQLKAELPDKAAALRPIELIGYILLVTDYFNYLQRTQANAVERIENIKELIEFSSRFEKMEEFLERISLLESTDTVKKKDLKNIKDNVVNLMTIHMAKGSEFDAVFVIGVNDGLLPHQMSYHNESEIEEERRLMYVAMTRARRELYLTFYNLPSRFLSEIPSGLMEFEGGRGFDDEERYIDMD